MKEVKNTFKNIWGKISKSVMEHKRVAIGICIAVVILVVGVIVVPKAFVSKNNEKTLNNYLMEMGKDFYENYYYERTGKNDEERKEFLSKYSTTGIKIDLENLARYNGQANKAKVDAFVNSVTNEECDKKETKVTIIPKEGYGKTDYEIKVDLVCGSFEKK